MKTCCHAFEFRVMVWPAKWLALPWLPPDKDPPFDTVICEAPSV